MVYLVTGPGAAPQLSFMVLWVTLVILRFPATGTGTGGQGHVQTDMRDGSGLQEPS